MNKIKKKFETIYLDYLTKKHFKNLKSSLKHENNIHFMDNPSLKCTGCAACVNACEFNAIKMVENKTNTFLYPKIDSNLCIKCNKCREVCPQNEFKKINNKIVKPIAFQSNDEIRYISSSGGCFPILAKNIILKGGIVYCAILGDKQVLNHKRICSLDDLEKGYKAKYVQSNIGYTYREAKTDLESGKTVLFAGTPCQIAGLTNYLKKDYENLYKIDILCHGVPSQSFLNEYLKEINHEKPLNINFRDKSIGWRCDTILIKYKDSKYKKSLADGDPYEFGFHMNITLRNSCHSCSFAEFPRTGDISMGDFWGIEKFLNVDNKGTSLVFINNDKGRKLFEMVKSNNYCEELEIDSTTLANRIKLRQIPYIYQGIFYKIYQKKGFKKAINYTRNLVLKRKA